MRSLKKQQGLSSLAWLVIILCAVFFSLCAFKVVPIYANNMYITGAMKTLKVLVDENDDPATISKTTVRSYLSNQFIINNIRGNEIDALDVDNQRNKLIVNLNYEVRVTLFYNVDVVVSFKNQFDSSRPHECCTPASE